MNRGSRILLSSAGKTALFAIATLSAGQAFANTTDWTLSAGGTYTSTGGSGSVLVGSNIPTLAVLGDGTPVKNGAAVSIVDGFLNFTSGAYNGNGSNWSWGSGGVLNLTGCIPGVTAKVCTGSNNVNLVSDDFQSVKIETILGSLDAVFGNITGTLNAQVAAYFGVASQFQTASFGTGIVTSGTPGSSLSGVNLLGHIKAAPVTSVPERWGIGESLAFFGLVILLFTALVRFKLLRPALVN
jgi:hypothetical protein